TSSVTEAPAPHHKSPTEAHYLHGDILETGLLPGVDRPADWILPIQLGDARPEESPYSVPLQTAGGEAGDWQHESRICQPPGTPERARRHHEFETCDDSAGPHDPGEFVQRFLRVVHVTEQVGEGEGVEARVRKRERLGPAVDELHAPRLVGLGHP